ncbi:hypothetical protein PHAMO_10224 [Magnetospirillum molischianum DSM 120]|uniref:Uncharacterized protein n=1 Tax=Magnetospirillum molischianum DSM 120 TaxID=1150626 RepID=H8FN61_MAGML|nr:hypothetical protein PHAMO_10224 [Magnetospirillum molischianum DSM 120]
MACARKTDHLYADDKAIALYQRPGSTGNMLPKRAVVFEQKKN